MVALGGGVFGVFVLVRKKLSLHGMSVDVVERIVVSPPGERGVYDRNRSARLWQVFFGICPSGQLEHVDHIPDFPTR